MSQAMTRLTDTQLASTLVTKLKRNTQFLSPERALSMLKSSDVYATYEHAECAAGCVFLLLSNFLHCAVVQNVVMAEDMVGAAGRTRSARSYGQCEQGASRACAWWNTAVSGIFDYFWRVMLLLQCTARLISTGESDERRALGAIRRFCGV